METFHSFTFPIYHQVHFCYFVSFAGAWDLSRAYWDQQVANHQHSDQYFYARGNYDASKRGPGGIWAAKVIR